MSKTCPHCQHEFGRPESSEFYARQFSDFLFCSMCAEKVYAVIPPVDSFKYKAMNVIVSFGPILLAIAALMVSFLLSFELGLMPTLLIGGVVLGGIFFLRRMFVRRIYWKFAIMQTSPFVE